MHKLDDDTLVTVDLLRKFIEYAMDETNDERHYAIMQRQDRSWMVHNPGSPELDPVQQAYSQKLLTRLNDELHHDGAWVILWSGPGQRHQFVHVANAYSIFNLMWMDQDGDVKFRFEWAAGSNEDWPSLIDLFLAGDLPICEQAETAWQMANTIHVQAMEIAQKGEEGVTFKKALGEKAPTLQ